MRRLHATSFSFALIPAVAVLVSGCEVQPGVAASGALALEFAIPEEVGMSSERLTNLHDAMQQLVDDRRLAGITTMVARHGRVVDFQTFGYGDIEAGTRMEEDAIFRIYSMSKPITGVALMTLYEEGKFRLSDPVQRYIPEFTDLKVAGSWGPNGPVLEDADHPMTIRELMSHTAGLAYGIGGRGSTDSLYAANRVLARDQTLADMVDKLGAMPLEHQPGSRWDYSIAVDVQGYLVEVLSGQPFDEFLQERIFDPLRMPDTGFDVPEEDHDRFVQYYRYGAEGELVPTANRAAPAGSRAYYDPTTFFSGGGGLVSTTTDYMRFAQMMLNGGELDGVRILSPTTVALMSRNQMPRDRPERSPGVGFGLDFSVVLDAVGKEYVSVGEYSWGGAAGTWFWIDPVEDLIFVGMIQQTGGRGRPAMGSMARQLTYQAITGP
jgi:CubicO group peptidase (beta-lactamase class C family)